MTDNLMSKISADQKVRREIAREDHLWFFNLYFSEYVQSPSAQFHYELFRLSQDPDLPLLAVIAFRGSAKSTIMSMSLPLWSILGKDQRKFVLILGQTQAQAKMYMSNLRDQLEGNDLLKADLGPFQERTETWGATTLVIPKHNARISIASSEQSVRGLRHGPHRPDLIVLDDVEDIASTKTREGRDRTYQWLTNEILPIGGLKTKTVIIGNLLHDDSLLKRLEEDIKEGRRFGEFRQYAIIDEHGNPTWPGKYPDQAALDYQKKLVGDEHAWAREYLLTIIPDVDRPIQKEWIQYYDELPTEYSRYTRIAVDLAISEKDTADYTAIIPARVYGYGDDMKIYILPHIINQRLTFPNVVNKLEEMFSVVEGYSQATEIVVEDVGYQGALHQWLSKKNIPARGFKIQGQDKHARLKVAGYPVQNGTVLFPRKGAEQLIQQLVYFGIEKHDDLADAFSILVNDSMGRNYRGCRVFANKPRGW
jgi:predicted phage terminase large subunit-like protein